jgi:DNA (cytosine-5)-methyltransferase 1
MTGFTRDDFAAGGGWSEALRLLGLKEDAAIEFDASAVATAVAAGHTRWLVDVTACEVRERTWPPLWLYIASPPCQTFSQGGNGAGVQHFAALTTAAHLVAKGALPEDAVAAVADEKLDVRSVLVLEPLNVIRDHRPANVALEQVPPVLPLWRVYEAILREWGYRVWTGYVHSEQFGVPQTRKRAVLIASLEREVSAPVPTHSRYHARTPDRLDEGVAPWVSLASALGGPELPAPNGGDTSWIYRRPSPTIVGSFRPDIIAAPGYRKAGDPPRQKTPGSVQVTVEQAAALQSFRPGYPWQGSDAKKFEQIGNAVPPLMGAAVLRAVLGL